MRNKGIDHKLKKINCPIGENSSNLVTLFRSHTGGLEFSPVGRFFFLGQCCENCSSSANFRATFFHGICVTWFRQNSVGLQIVRLFHKLILSPCRSQFWFSGGEIVHDDNVATFVFVEVGRARFSRAWVGFGLQTSGPGFCGLKNVCWVRASYFGHWFLWAWKHF
jgi:hypothetical protein